MYKSQYLQDRENFAKEQVSNYTKENIQDFFGINIVPNNGKYNILRNDEVLFENQESWQVCQILQEVMQHIPIKDLF